jgi:amino acid adenylation domain-containing protein
MPSTYESSNPPAGRPVAVPWSDRHEDLVIGPRFDRVADLMDDHPAIVIDGQSYSYATLRDRTDRVVRHLHGIGQSGRVVIYLTDALDQSAAALGALKAGWTYIPMDPTYPSGRSGQILDDANPDLILTCPEGRQTIGNLGIGPGDRRFQMIEEVFTAPSGPPIEDQSRPETPALILYTSGSTGRPKGVLHTHQSIAHNCLRRSRIQRIVTDDRLTLLYSNSVMGGIYGIYGAFLNGATLCPLDIKREGFSGFADWLRAGRITVYHCVTSLFRQTLSLIEAGNRFPDLRMIILGGEQVLGADIDRGRESFAPEIEFYCGIGSTETGSVCHFPITSGTKVKSGPVPLGYPIDGMSVLLLDSRRKPIGDGRTGEIAVRSPYLATEYWRRPDLTRERFIKDPEGGPLPVYLTGDLGIIDDSGCLTGRGRADQQVKIRGFRVEPAEIDTAALNHPEIRESRTVARLSPTGATELVCFYVRCPNGEVTGSALRAYLQAELPAYMVPKHLVELDAFPRTPNGKIDAPALQLPESAASAESVEPTTRTEKRLAAIWAASLERKNLSIDQPFFDQGGNSLSAAVVSARIEKVFRRRMPITLFFQFPTIRKLAAWIDDGEVKSAWSCLVPIRPEGSGHPLYVIGGMTGEVVFCRQLVEHLKTDRPIYALEPDTLSGGRTRFNRIEDVADDYAKAILTHQPKGPFFIAGYSFGGTVAYELVRQLSARGHEIARTIILDSMAPGLRTPGSSSDGDGPLNGKDKPADRVQGSKKASKLRFFKPSWWLRSKGHWRRSYWRLKYVRLYELLIRLQLSPPIAWRPYYSFWATHWMGQRYRASPYYGSTILFRSDAREKQGDKGWRKLCGDNLQMIRVPGDHGSIFSEPNVRTLAREMDKALDMDDGGWEMFDGRWEMGDV